MKKMKKMILFFPYFLYEYAAHVHLKWRGLAEHAIILCPHLELLLLAAVPASFHSKTDE